MVSKFQRLLRYLRRKAFFEDRRGFGRPVPAAVLNEEYRSGHWDHFFSPEEALRYEAIVQLIKTRGEKLRVVDFGCGSGRLAQVLPPESYASYLGVDLSTEGLAKARALNLARCEFREGNFESFELPGVYDLIIFNESISYARCPWRVAQACIPHLSSKGVLLVSLLRFGNHPEVWKSLKGQFRSCAEREVLSPSGAAWDLALLEPDKRN